MSKPKLEGSSIQWGWFCKYSRVSPDFSYAITNDLTVYQDLSFCIRQLAVISRSKGEFFTVSEIELTRQRHLDASPGSKKVWEPMHVKSAKIGQIMLHLINSSIYQSATKFSFYQLHPTIRLFLLWFPGGLFDQQLGSRNSQFFFFDPRLYADFNSRCKKFREELNSARFKLECRNFERNSQDSKLKLKNAIDKLLRKKKWVYVLRLDLDLLQSPSPGSLVEATPHSLFDSSNPRACSSIEILSVDIKEKWEALCRWLRRSKHTPKLLGHASRLHCFPSIGCRLHVLLIFEWMTYSEGRLLRDKIVRHWEDHLTSGQGVADSKKSSLSVSSFPGCGEISAKSGSRLDEVYKQAIPYLTDMDLYMGRIIKHRTFNMWHSK